MGNIAQIQGTRELTAEFESLQNGRWRLTRRVMLQGAGNVDDATFKSLGALLSAEYAVKGDETKFANLVLVREGVGTDIVNRAQAVVWTGVYETLTGSFVGEVDDVTDYEMNGLKRVTRTLIALAGTSVGGFVVGTQTYSSAPTLYLAKVKVEENDAYVRVVAEYLEPGAISKAESSGPNNLPNTKQHTWVSWYTVPSDLLPAIPGVVTDIRQDNVNGYPVWVYTSLSLADGTTPLVVLKTYRDVAEVTKPGTVSIGLYDDGTTKRVPYLVTVPPKAGKIDCEVTVELTATSPSSSIKPTAYNLEDLSVGVVTQVIREEPLGYDEGSTITVSVYTDQVSIQHDTLRGYYYTDASSRSGVEYTYRYNAQIIRDNDNVIGETLTADVKTMVSLSGSTGYVAPVAGDVIDKRVEPVFVSITDGAQIFRVTTIKVV